MIQPELHFYDFGEGVRAFSSTRHGGFSKGHYAAFNINHYCGDSEEDISKNRALLCQLLGIGETNLIMPHQVHKTEVATIDEAFLELSAEVQKARLEGVDALMTDMAGVCIGVSTADCIPILLFDKAHHASCAIHAGWRGTVKRIVEKAVAQMMSVYGSRPADLLAQIGPGIHAMRSMRLLPTRDLPAMPLRWDLSGTSISLPAIVSSCWRQAFLQVR